MNSTHYLNVSNLKNVTCGADFVMGMKDKFNNWKVNGTQQLPDFQAFAKHSPYQSTNLRDISPCNPNHTLPHQAKQHFHQHNQSNLHMAQHT